MALGWQAPHHPALYHLYQLSAADTRRSAVIHSGLPENQSAPSGPRGDVRLAARQNQSVASRAVAGAANRAAPVRNAPSRSLTELAHQIAVPEDSAAEATTPFLSRRHPTTYPAPPGRG